MVHGVGTKARAARPGQGAAEGRRTEPGAHQPLPARVLRRPAPAHRGGPGAGPQPQLHGARRAGLGTRRVDPGPGAQPDGRPPGGVRTHVSCSSPTTCRWCATSPIGSPSCISGGSPRWPIATRCTNEPMHPYTHALLSAVPDPRSRTWSTAGSASSWRATSRRRPTLRPVAASTPAARRPSSGVCDVDVPELRELEPDHWVACHFPEVVTLL